MKQNITHINIIGNSGNCSGSSVTLLGNCIGSLSGPLTYTWSSNAGGVHTQTVTVSPTSVTVYSLTASDGTNSPTQTFTVSPMPTSQCTVCSIVQNGSFDNYSTCPDDINETYYSYPWTCSGGTTDYYNSCATYSTNIQVPISSMGNEGNHTTGTNTGGYEGLIAYDDNIGTPSSYREYFMQQLKCPLISGQSYNISFWASEGDYCSYLCNIGMALTQSIFAPTATLPQPITPQLLTSTPVGSVGWTQVTLNNFIGNNEQFITIGNFNDDTHCGVVSNPNVMVSPITGTTAPTAYYFIDDISITAATPTLTASAACSGSTFTLTATGAASAYTTWQGPNSYSASGSVVSASTPTTTGTYTCTVDLSSVCPTCSPI